MDNVELCARNVSAALREVRNAYNAAEKIDDPEERDKAVRELDQVIHHLEGLSLMFGRLQKERPKSLVQKA